MNQVGEDFWQHILRVHATRNQFPSPLFLHHFDRLIPVCSVLSCHWICHNHFRNSRCPRQGLGLGERCGGTLADPSSLDLLVFKIAPTRPRNPAPTPTQNQPRAANPYSTVTFGIQAANDIFIDTPFLSFAADIINTTLETILTLPTATISHIPCGVRLLWAQILSTKLSHTHSGSIWGAIWIMMLAKCGLRLPPRGGKSRCFSTTTF